MDEEQKTDQEQSAEAEVEATDSEQDNGYADAIAEIKTEYETKIAKIKTEYDARLNERDKVIKQLLTADSAAEPAEDKIITSINSKRNYKKW